MEKSIGEATMWTWIIILLAVVFCLIAALLLWDRANRDVRRVLKAWGQSDEELREWSEAHLKRLIGAADRVLDRVSDILDSTHAAARGVRERAVRILGERR